jgi:hypothetical protein
MRVGSHFNDKRRRPLPLAVSLESAQLLDAASVVAVEMEVERSEDT